jgi:hypothetical protein
LTTENHALDNRGIGRNSLLVPTYKLDRELASELLTQGRTVRQVAIELGVSTQAIYEAIRLGQVVRPEVHSAA